MDYDQTLRVTLLSGASFFLIVTDNERLDFLRGHKFSLVDYAHLILVWERYPGASNS